MMTRGFSKEIKTLWFVEVKPNFNGMYSMGTFILKFVWGKLSDDLSKFGRSEKKMKRDGDDDDEPTKFILRLVTISSTPESTAKVSQFTKRQILTK